jgi:predicted lipoprotein with Yx(FWY)xxD motif
MRKFMLGLAAATLAFGAGLSAETKTVTGVLVDVMCNTKQGTEKATGAGHADCAAACAKKGAPLAVAGDGGIYEVTGAWTENKNEKLVQFAGHKVEATGEVTEADGKKTIALTAIKMAH